MWGGLGSTGHIQRTYGGLMRISEYLLLQIQKTIVTEDHKELIECLPAEDDLYISEVLMEMPGAVFYHLQISRRPQGGHVAKVLYGFDTVEQVIETESHVPAEIAKARDEVLDNQDAVFNFVLQRDC